LTRICILNVLLQFQLCVDQILCIMEISSGRSDKQHSYYLSLPLITPLHSLHDITHIFLLPLLLLQHIYFSCLSYLPISVVELHQVLHNRQDYLAHSVNLNHYFYDSFPHFYHQEDIIHEQSFFIHHSRRFDHNFL